MFGRDPNLLSFRKIASLFEAQSRRRPANANVTYVPGTKITRGPGPVNTTPTNIDAEVDIPAAVRAAQAADVVVLCLGEGSYTETPGNITDLTLPEPQLKLAEAIQATGKPVVIVLVEGRPRVINRIVEKAAAILMAYNPGNEGGQAIADVIFGDFNPSGKLPFTYPRTPNGLITYDHKAFETEDTAFGNVAFKPQFEFGEGLSYTTFVYRDLTLGTKDDLRKRRTRSRGDSQQYGSNARDRKSFTFTIGSRGLAVAFGQTS